MSCAPRRAVPLNTRWPQRRRRSVADSHQLKGSSRCQPWSHYNDVQQKRKPAQMHNIAQHNLEAQGCVEALTQFRDKVVNICQYLPIPVNTCQYSAKFLSNQVLKCANTPIHCSAAARTVLTAPEMDSAVAGVASASRLLALDSMQELFRVILPAPYLGLRWDGWDETGHKLRILFCQRTTLLRRQSPVSDLEIAEPCGVGQLKML